MTKPLKVTFKKVKKPSGLAGVGWGWRLEAKVKGKKCASLWGGQARSNKVTIQVAVKKERTPQDPAPFRWIFVENNCVTEEDAKTVVQTAVNDIAKDHELHFFED